jgi:hypothetical protein
LFRTAARFSSLERAYVCIPAPHWLVAAPQLVAAGTGDFGIRE